MAAVSVHAATNNLASGYVVGGFGPAVFLDHASGGGGDSSQVANGDPGFSVQMTNLWQIGDVIQITGVALPIRPVTTAGTFTFNFFSLDSGANADLFDGVASETMVGTGYGQLVVDASTGAYSVTFDPPIVFTAASRGIAVQFTNFSTASYSSNRFKINTAANAPNAVRVNSATGVPSGGTNPNMRFTLAGSVVVPPAVGSLIWQGNTSADWNVATTNWNRHLGGYLFTPDKYTDNGSFGPQVIFDDTLVSPFRTNVNLTTGTPLRPGSIIFANGAYQYSFGGPGKITGATVITNQGSGVVTLNTANDFTGGSVLSGGRVRLGNAGGLGVGTISFLAGALSSVGAAPVTVTNRISLPGNAVLGNQADNGVITLSGILNFAGGAAAIDAQSDVLISGVLTNGGLSSKTGPGTLTITGTDYQTNVTWAIRKGTFVFNAPTPAYPLNGLRIGASDPNGVAITIITNGSVINLVANGDLRVGMQAQSAITSSNYLDLSGSILMPLGSTSGLVMGQASAYDQVDIRPGSVLQVGSLIQSQTGRSVLNVNSATLIATSSTTNFMSGLSNVTFTGTVVIDSGSNTLTAAQRIQGGGGLTKQGAGTLWLRGNNSYSGSTIVQAGTLGLYPGASPNNVLTASAVVVSNGAALAADFVPVGPGTAEITSLALNGSTVSVNYGNLAGSPSGTVAFGGPGSTGVPMTISGVQTIKLAGQNWGIGQYPIIQFSTLTGSGSWVASLPPGIAGTVQTNGSQIVVNITSAPKSLTWYGSTDSSTFNQNWNTTSFNWNGTADKYSETGGVGDFVRFDDSAFFNGLDYATNVNLTASLAPVTMTVDNSSVNYRFATTGAGKLTGALTALVKTNAGSMTILTANDHAGGSALYGPGAVLVGNNSAFGTGVVGLNGAAVSSDGLTARTLTNTLSIGAAANTLGDAVNSGTLNLTGPVDFGGSGRDLAVNSPVVFSGSMTNGGLDEKTGPATLTFSGVTGTSSAGQLQVEDGSFIISGGTLAKSGGGLRVGSTIADGVARFVITNGAVVTMVGAGLNARVGNDQSPAASATSTNILDVAGTLAWTTNSAGSVFMGSAGQLAQVNLRAGGLLQVGAFSGGANASELNLNGGTLSPTASRPDFLQGLTAANVLAGGVTIDTAGFDIGVAQPLLNGGGGLTKIGAGTLALNGVNTYSGLTTVSAGALGGTGVISGPVTIGALGTLSPGASIGTLTINHNLTLGGNVLVEVNKSVAPSNDVVAVSGALSYGGTITVTNLGPALTIGDSFPVFPAGGTGTVTVTGNAGPGQAFSLNKTTGVISVVASLPAPTTLNYANLGDGVFQFSWTGAFKLQYQTNAASTGLKTNWVDYPNPSNPVNVTNNPAVPTTFFRLINL
jgi:autotransporter-associated beta strand protein